MNRIPDDQGGGSAEKPLTPATRLVTGGRDPFAQHGFVNTPIYRGSTVLYRNAEDFLQRKAKFTYGTKGTPTTDSLEVAWTDLTGAAGTVLVPSGLAAISIALLCCLKSGDHLLVPDSVYRPTRNFCDSMLKRFGVETTYYDPLLGADIARAVQAQYARGVHRGAGLAVVRDAGHSGDRRGRACARRRSC